MRVLWTHTFDPELKRSGMFLKEFGEALRNHGVDLQLLHLGNLRSLTNLLRTQALLRRIAGEFDLIHAQYGSVGALITATVKDVPKILSLRGSDWYRYKEKLNYQSLHGVVATTVSRKAMKGFDLIIAMSHRMAEEIASCGKYPPVVTLPDPIDLQSFQPIDKHVARARLGFPNDKTKWILFTTLSDKNPIKRIRLAQKAVNMAAEKIGNITLRVATGLSHQEMPLFVAACDLVLCTSTYEGWPNAVKEALACNIPFVATDVSDLCKIAAQEPSCRICAPDASIIAEQICEVLSSSNQGNLCRHVAEMDVPVISEALLNLYEEVITNKRIYLESRQGR